MTTTMAQQFDVFAQLVATGNIASAARVLEIQPATVVETMNRLEDQIGCQIFTISEGMVELTETGRKVVKALGELSADMRQEWADRFAESAGKPIDYGDDLGSGLAGTTEPAFTPRHFEPEARAAINSVDTPEPSVETIVVASHPSIFSHFQEALVAFEQASPDVDISLRLESLDESATERLFRDKLADIAYYYALGEPKYFMSRYAWSERISLFVSARHPLAGKDAIQADDLRDLPYVALAPANITRQLAETALRQNGMDVGEPALESDDLYKIMKYVESDVAYFAAFGPMARDFGQMNGITRLAFAQGLPQIQVRQAVRQDRMDAPAILALSEFLFR